MTTEITRTFNLETRAYHDDEERTVEMAISSEAPYERFFGIEILRHTAEAVDLSRLADGRHPLLLGHDPDQQIGVIQSARIDEDRKLRGVARFSRAPKAQEILADVRDEIRTLVSVGYMIQEVEEQKKNEAGEVVTRTLTGEEFLREMRDEHGDNFYRAGPAACRAKGSEPLTYIVTRWQPFEASVVPIPADVEVGVGRAAAAAADSGNGNISGRSEPANPNESNRRQSPMSESKDPTALEAERRDAILALGEQYAKYVGQKDIADALRNGRPVEAFRDTIMEKMEKKHADTSQAHIGMTKQEVKRYSFARALQAALTGDWRKAGLELEASEAIAKLLGRGPEGFYVPYDIFRRDFNVGTSTEAGNLVATDLRGDLYVDALRNAMVMGKMGIMTLAGLSSNVDLPRKSTASTLAALTEIGSASETQPLTAKATLSPKRVGAYVEVSKQAIIQAAMSLENMIRDDLVVGAAVLIENYAINGAGTAGQATGIRNTSGIGTVTEATNGTALIWDHLVDMESAAADANAEPDRGAGYLINTKTRGKSKKVQKGTNLPFLWDGGDMPLNGYRVGVSNNVLSNLTKGTSTTIASNMIFASDWSLAALGLFGAPDVVVDPYSKADTGQVKITLNQFYDFAIRQPKAFVSRNDILTT